MSTDIAVVDSTYVRSSLEERKAYAQALSAAGELVPSGFRDRDGKPNAAKVLLAFEYGAMVGLHPVASLQGINVIEGKTSPSPALMTALVRRAGHKLRIRKTGSWMKGDYSVTVTLIRADDPQHPFEETWDADRAKRAGLLPPPGPKSSWSRYPEAMCMWRATSAVCREGAEDVLFGLHYIPEELGAEVNEAGDVIDGEIVDDEPPTKPAAEPVLIRSGPRKPPAQEPELSDEDRHAIADEFAVRSRRALTVSDARDLYREAAHRGILTYPLTNGELLEDVLRARGEHLADEEAQAVDDLPLDLEGEEVI